MSSEVRNVFILAGCLVVYGVALWLYETKAFATWTESFVASPRARFAQGEREELIEEEFAVSEEPADGTD